MLNLKVYLANNLANQANIKLKKIKKTKDHLNERIKKLPKITTTNGL